LIALYGLLCDGTGTLHNRTRGAGSSTRPRNGEAWSEASKASKKGPFSVDHKAKLRAARQYQQFTEQSRVKLSASLKAFYVAHPGANIPSEAKRARMRASKQVYWANVPLDDPRRRRSPEVCANVRSGILAHWAEHSRVGQGLGRRFTQSEEAKARRKGRKLSQEHKNKIGAASRGRKHSEASRAKIREARARFKAAQYARYRDYAQMEMMT
jgi:hypothetical protein